MSFHRESPDFAVREIEMAMPRLRDDLRWTFQEVRGEGSYLLEDPLQGKFYRLGAREHAFVRSLDGRHTVAALVSATAKGDPRLAFESEEAASLVRMLVDAGLVVSDDASHAGRVYDEVNRPTESKRAVGKVSQVLFLKLPLGNPDRFFAWLAAKAGWLAGPWFAAIWIAVVLWGALSLHGEKERFVAQMSGLFEFGNLWMLGVLWLVLKVFHECWHGFVCRYFGGVVPEAGVTLLLFTTPLGYVNASSSTAFPSRWHRLAVAGAGMYGELFVAAIAAIVWSRVEPGMLSAALHQVVVLSSVTTVLFNANPLMRFDGYYILSDLLDIPNLYGKGQNVAGWLARRGLLGMRKAKYPLRKGEPGLLIGAYGIAASVWKVVVMVGLLLATAFLFEGAGLLLAIVVGAAMLVQSITGAAKYLKKNAAAEGLRPARLIARVVCFLTILAAALVTIEITPTATAPAVVRDVGGGEVRVRCPGFLRELVVRAGDQVKEGDLLARLENVEEQSRLLQIETEIQRSRLRRDALLKEGQIAASQAEEEHLAGLEGTAGELREHVASLELRAPRAGRIDGRHLELLVGTWIETGRPLFSVFEGNRRELVILAAPSDRERFDEAREAALTVTFRPRGRVTTWEATLADAVPSAGMEPAHFALITPSGGPLAVRHRTGAAAQSATTEPGKGGDPLASYELTKPRFEWRASLLADEGELREGEIGTVKARGTRAQTLAALAWQGLQRQFEVLKERAGGA